MQLAKDPLLRARVETAIDGVDVTIRSIRSALFALATGSDAGTVASKEGAALTQARVAPPG
jgi:hypothetical protein